MSCTMKIVKQVSSTLPKKLYRSTINVQNKIRVYHHGSIIYQLSTMIQPIPSGNLTVRYGKWP